MTNITTIQQATQHIMETGIVDFDNGLTVEGKKMLEVCGYSVPDQKTVTRYLKRQIEKHDFVEGVDFKSDIDVTSESRKKPMVYQFTLNAASHVLLAAMTDQGKQARQQAIDTQQVLNENQELRDMVKQALQAAEANNQTIAMLVQSNNEILELSQAKSTPLSLSKLLLNNNLVAQAANLWLEDEGMIVQRFSPEGKKDGWTVTDKGKGIGGVQISDKQVNWTPKVKMYLPSTKQLLDFAKELGLKDHKNK